MYLADSWLDYEIIDAGGGEKLERWGDVTLLRPDPQAVWPMARQRQAGCALYPLIFRRRTLGIQCFPCRILDDTLA